MKYHQYQLTFDNNKGEAQTIGTFWIDSDGNVDANNLPSEREICLLLKSLEYSNVRAVSTGNVVCDE